MSTRFLVSRGSSLATRQTTWLKQQQKVFTLSTEATEEDKTPAVQYKKVSYDLNKSRKRVSTTSNRKFSIYTESSQQNLKSLQKPVDEHTNSPSPAQEKSTPYPSKKSDNSESRERLTNIRKFYANPAIDKLSDKPLIRLNPISMMYMGGTDDDPYQLKTANYLRHELPIRLAHMIKEIRHLPFIIAVNPAILEIHERCIKTFHIFDDFDKVIKDPSVAREFSENIFNMLEMNKDLLVLLCDGFKDSRRYIRNEEYIRSNLNRILSSRLGIRLLCEHFIALNKNYEDNQLSKETDYIGIIHKKFSPKKLIDKAGRMVTRICLDKYGVSPKLKIDGHTNVEFPYLSLPLEYILPELLKNSFRATCENHKDASVLPDVTCTIALNERDCIIRIRDRGGGIPHELVSKIFDYHYTTVSDSNDGYQGDNFSLSTEGSGDDGNYSNAMGMICEASSSRGLAVMHGYGFGLPTSRAYAEYLGGSLVFQSMQGIGSDFYLRIALIDNERSRVRI